MPRETIDAIQSDHLRNSVQLSIKRLWLGRQKKSPGSNGSPMNERANEPSGACEQEDRARLLFSCGF